MKRLLIGLILICSIGISALADDVMDKLGEIRVKIDKMKVTLGKVKIYEDSDLIYCLTISNQINKTEILILNLSDTYGDGRYFDEETKKSMYDNMSSISGQMDMILANIEEKASE